MRVTTICEYFSVVCAFERTVRACDSVIMWKKVTVLHGLCAHVLHVLQITVTVSLLFVECLSYDVMHVVSSVLLLYSSLVFIALLFIACCLPSTVMY